MLIMFGIPNCDTIKKAKKWLDNADVEYTFHDYKKLGVDSKVLEQAIAATSIDTVVNKRGPTYRKLSEQDKSLVLNEAEDKTALLEMLRNNPSAIKRPILVKFNGNIGESGESGETGNDNNNTKSASSIIVGFTDSSYQEFINDA